MKNKERRIPLIQARVATGLTMKEVADKVGVSATIIWRLENSWDVDTKPEIKESICKLYGLQKFPDKPEKPRRSA